MSSEPAGLARLSMSLPGDLFRQLDMMVEERGLPSRSQLMAELIRHALAQHEAFTRPDDLLAGKISIRQICWPRVFVTSRESYSGRRCCEMFQSLAFQPVSNLGQCCLFTFRKQ